MRPRKQYASPPPDEMRRILTDVRKGDLAQTGLLLEVIRPYLLATANAELSGKLQGKVSPSDVVQETLVELHRDFSQFKGEAEDEVRLWVRRVLLNNIRDAEDRFVNNLKRDVDREQALDSGDSREQLAQMADKRQATPSREAASRESVSRVEQAIDALSEDHRKVVRMRNFDQLSYADIASAMNRSERAVRMLHMRALADLARNYDRE